MIVEATAAPTGWTAAATASIVVAGITFAGVGIGIWQKWLDDRRQAWWSRAQWALEQLQPPDQTVPASNVQERRKVALDTIAYLAKSKLATDEEAEFFAKIASGITGIPNPPAAS
jgi:hypothetical protein